MAPDLLWEQVAPLLPAPAPRPYRHHGRQRADDRAALAGIVFVLRHGVDWLQVPQDSLGVSGVTCWRRLAEWTKSGVWPRLHEAVLAQMRREGLLDLDEMSIDGSHMRALKGGPCRSLPDRPGTARVKHHLIVDTNGTPLKVSLTGGNRHDVTQLLPLVDSLPAIRGVVGRPRRKPRVLYANRGYDYDKYRRELRERGITPKIARRGVAPGPGSAPSGGSSNAGSPGSTSSNVSAPATRSAPTCTWDSCTWPAP